MAKKVAFLPGDKVRVNFCPNGPWMYVASKPKKGGAVLCRWFTSTGEFQEVPFEPEVLETYDAVRDSLTVPMPESLPTKVIGETLND
jgi:uncharacterized protein YodC (DUF2158 family)